jgi:LacI family transcriptional regulator
MEDEKGKITLKDVARMAGVSRGTVDRVIHNRGEVSKESYDNVMRVIKDIGYETNIYASILAHDKSRTVVLLLPSFRPGEYWEMAERGAEQARAYARTFHVNIETVLYDQYDIDSFREACSHLLALSPSAVVLAPIFRNETAVLTATLRERGIPYSYVDTKLEEDGYLTFYGMPMYKSGYLCAELLFDSIASVPESAESMRVAIIRIERDRQRKSDPTATRREGFFDYMMEHYPGVEIRSVFINPRDPASIVATLSAFFEKYPGITHIAMFNSRIHLIAPALETLRAGDMPRAVGFDNLDGNLAALRRGSIKYLITQHTDEQTRLAVNSLVDYLVLNKEPERRDNYLHMDILTRSNVEDY